MKHKVLLKYNHASHSKRFPEYGRIDCITIINDNRILMNKDLFLRIFKRFLVHHQTDQIL